MFSKSLDIVEDGNGTPQPDKKAVLLVTAAARKKRAIYARKWMQRGKCSVFTVWSSKNLTLKMKMVFLIRLNVINYITITISFRTSCKCCRAVCRASLFLYSTLVTFHKVINKSEVFNKNSCVRASSFSGNLGSAGNNYPHCACGNHTLTGGFHSWSHGLK